MTFCTFEYLGRHEVDQESVGAHFHSIIDSRAVRFAVVQGPSTVLNMEKGLVRALLGLPALKIFVGRVGEFDLNSLRLLVDGNVCPIGRIQNVIDHRPGGHPALLKRTVYDFHSIDGGHLHGTALFALAGKVRDRLGEHHWGSVDPHRSGHDVVPFVWVFYPDLESRLESRTAFLLPKCGLVGAEKEGREQNQGCGWTADRSVMVHRKRG